MTNNPLKEKRIISKELGATPKFTYKGLSPKEDINKLAKQNSYEAPTQKKKAN